MTVVAGLGLDELISLRDADRDAIAARFGVKKVAEGVSYEGLDRVDRLDPDELGAHFFFRGDEQKMLYVPHRALEDAHPDAIAAELGKPAARLRSRTGADSQVWVYPERGVAFASDGNTVEILEIFKPTTLERYKDEIYNDPGEFIR